MCEEMNQYLLEMIDRMEKKEKEIFYYIDLDQEMNYLFK